MSKKIPLGIAIAAAFIAAAFSIAVTVSVYTDSYNKMIRDLPQRTQQYAVLSEIDEIIRDNYYGEADRDAILQNIAAGYIQGLGDEQCFYISESNLSAYKSALSGVIPGSGITAAFDPANGCLSVRSVAADSPAAEVGIAVGDAVFSVDGVAVTQANSASLIDSLLYSEKKTTELGFIKAAAPDGVRQTLKLTNGYTAQSCVVRTVGAVGYIHLSDFYTNTKELFDAALDDFSDRGISSLILDVRNNASINYENACAIIDRIVPLATEGTGAIATAKDTEGETVKLFSSDSTALNMSIAVLINDRTAGAAELLACDLRDFGKAKLFGEKTAGEGLYPQLFELEDGGAVMLAVAEVFPYISEPYEGSGVAPDTEVPMLDMAKSNIPPETFDSDPQFAAAYAFFTQQ